MRRSIVLLLLLLAVLAGVTPAAARSYHFRELHIEAVMHSDGSLWIEEHRTTEFDGVFSGMYRHIPLDQGITLTDIEVSERGQAYRKEPGPDPGPPGTFFVQRDDEQAYIDWSFAAENETRTFTLGYRMMNAVRVHDDVAELEILWVGDDWDQGVDRVIVELQLPSAAAEDTIRVFGHGPLHGEVELLEAGLVRWEVAPLPARTFVEGRVLFTPAAVPGSENRTGETALQAILDEEAERAAQADRQRFWERILIAAGAVLVLLTLLGSVFFWFRFGRAHRPSFSGEYMRELPGDYTPAEMSILMGGGVAAKDMTATLLDLARRKHITIEEFTPERRGLLGKKRKVDYRLRQVENSDDQLAEHETHLLSFLFDTVALDGEVTFSEIEAFSRKNRRSFARFWDEWKQTVRKQAEELDFFDQASRRPRIWTLVIGFVLALGSIPLFMVLPVLGVAVLVSGGIALIAGAVMHRRSIEGSEALAKWKAFRRFLLHFSELQRHEIPSLVLWEHYLVYAVSLGVAKQVMKQLEVVYPNLQDDSHRFGYGWYYAMGGPATAGFAQSMDSLTSNVTQSIQQSVRTATSSSSSSSGSGGGFSSGGGGGVGGGGGGVR